MGSPYKTTAEIISTVEYFNLWGFMLETGRKWNQK